jgi:hypothetical protein
MARVYPALIPLVQDKSMLHVTVTAAGSTDAGATFALSPVVLDGGINRVIDMHRAPASRHAGGGVATRCFVFDSFPTCIKRSPEKTLT